MQYTVNTTHASAPSCVFVVLLLLLLQVCVTWTLLTCGGWAALRPTLWPASTQSSACCCSTCRWDSQLHPLNCSASSLNMVHSLIVVLRQMP
jgi:hypothetical protein